MDFYQTLGLTIAGLTLSGLAWLMLHERALFRVVAPLVVTLGMGFFIVVMSYNSAYNSGAHAQWEADFKASQAMEKKLLEDAHGQVQDHLRHLKLSDENVEWASHIFPPFDFDFPTSGSRSAPLWLILEIMLVVLGACVMGGIDSMRAAPLSPHDQKPPTA